METHTIPAPKPEELYPGIGKGDFHRVGEKMVKLCRDFADLQPNARVLEVGSGIGRVAAGLTRYLTGGSYEGFDWVAQGVEWCEKNITSRYPTFRFRHIDVASEYYNPTGTTDPREFEFPYPEKEFDFVIVSTAFAHMPPAEMFPYLREIHRVLKPGGRAYLSFYLLEGEVMERMADGLADLNFRFNRGTAYYANKHKVTAAMAYQLAFIREHLRKTGFDFRSRYVGRWSGVNGRSFQDVVLVDRPVLQ